MLVGTPSDWGGVIDSLVPDILDLVIDSWEAMTPPSSDAYEDPTTEELCKSLRLHKNSNKLPLRIYPQLVEIDPQAGEGQGRMDIVFLPMVPDESIYFCLECKRLNVVTGRTVRNYTSEYITHGMLRFIRGQYAAKVNQGGMLGYVFDGDVPRAMKNIGDLLCKRFEELGMEPSGEMFRSKFQPENSRVRETYHSRGHASDVFCIHHIFVAVPTEI